jgi:hypothetical protein
VSLREKYRGDAPPGPNSPLSVAEGLEVMYVKEAAAAAGAAAPS